MARADRVHRAEGPEIADAALFLASDQSQFITVSEIYVDGGASQV